MSGSARSHAWPDTVRSLAARPCQALDCARQLKELNTEARAPLHQVGVLHTHAASPDVVPGPKRTTSRLWPWPKNSGMRPLVAHCHRGLGTLYATTG